MIVVDSARSGEAVPLKHSVYAIVYQPSWLLLRYNFAWGTTSATIKSVSTMKEYYMAASIHERPIRAQRCYYIIKAINIFGADKFGLPKFSAISRSTLEGLRVDLAEYLAVNPVVAWDWIVCWTECQAMAEAFPDTLVSLYRRLRAHHYARRKPKTELAYFLDIVEEVSRKSDIDLEYK